MTLTNQSDSNELRDTIQQQKLQIKTIFDSLYVLYNYAGNEKTPSVFSTVLFANYHLSSTNWGDTSTTLNFGQKRTSRYKIDVLDADDDKQQPGNVSFRFCVCLLLVYYICHASISDSRERVSLIQYCIFRSMHHPCRWWRQK